MVKAQTTKEQNEIARRNGQALFAFACSSGGTFSCDGPLPHDIAKSLIALMGLVTVDRVNANRLREFVEREREEIE